MTVARNVAYPLAARKVAARRARRGACARCSSSSQLPDAGRPRRALALRRPAAADRARPRAGVRARACCCSTSRSRALDKQLRDAMQLEVRRIHERTGMTTIAVTHDQVEAMTMSDRVAILDDGRDLAGRYARGGLRAARPTCSWRASSARPTCSPSATAPCPRSASPTGGARKVPPSCGPSTALTGDPAGRPGDGDDASFQGTRLRLADQPRVAARRSSSPRPSRPSPTGRAAATRCASARPTRPSTRFPRDRHRGHHDRRRGRAGGSHP